MEALKILSELTITNLIALFLFVIPGFISIKVYGMLFPVPARDLSKQIINSLVYSALNYAAFSIPVFVLWDSLKSSPIFLIVMGLAIVVVAPACWPIAYSRLSEDILNKLRKVHPLPRPWDFLFRQGRHHWVVIHLKDGTRVGGIYGAKSFASSYPEEPQIYFQQVWKLGKKSLFQRPVARSEGMIIFGSEIKSLELFEYDDKGG